MQVSVLLFITVWLQAAILAASDKLVELHESEEAAIVARWRNLEPLEAFTPLEDRP
jgi:hypothetical protein